MNEIYLNNAGKIFTEQSGTLHGAGTADFPPEAQALISELCKNPYASFFKTPFYKVSYGINGRLYGEFSMTPGDFNPGSPFDAIYAVREYIRRGEIRLPRLYLYPTSVCDSHCPLCQFHQRHREATSLSSDAVTSVLDTFRAYSGGIRSQTLIISGDGEPTVFPFLEETLNSARDAGHRVFLTTNLRKQFSSYRNLYETIVRSCNMITVSIKGLSDAAYAHQQGVSSGEFERVMSNLEELISLRHQFGRKADCLVGVASLFLPENTPYYRIMIDRLHELGVDYFYINQVEPAAEHWGIFFTDDERLETLRQLSEYGKSPYTDMTVRCAGDPFKKPNRDTVYYDAANLRIHPELCGSALFNPLVLSSGGKARWLSCRNSDLFGDPAYEYEVKNNRITAKSVAGVMAAASGCRKCRLERQVKHFDKIADVEMAHSGGELEYYLVFDLCRLLEHDYCFIHFEDVVR